MNFGTWGVGLGIIPTVVVVGVLSWLVAHFWKSRWATIVPPIIGAVFGTYLAVSAARSPGYVAPYDFAIAWLLSVVFIGAGLPMLFFRGLRRGGVIALITGVAVLASFYMIVIPAKLLGFTVWRT